MLARSPPQLRPHPGNKRARKTSPERESSPPPPSLLSANAAASPTSEAAPDGAHTIKIGQSQTFRNVSACNRCRLRKNRCDQRLPSCSSCYKAAVPCVGYDPITKKEIPRR